MKSQEGSEGVVPVVWLYIQVDPSSRLLNWLLTCHLSILFSLHLYSALSQSFEFEQKMNHKKCTRNLTQERYITVAFCVFRFLDKSRYSKVCNNFIAFLFVWNCQMICKNSPHFFAQLKALSGVQGFAQMPFNSRKPIFFIQTFQR